MISEKIQFKLKERFSWLEYTIPLEPNDLEIAATEVYYMADFLENIPTQFWVGQYRLHQNSREYNLQT